MTARRIALIPAVLLLAQLVACGRDGPDESAPRPVTIETPKGTEVPVIRLTARAAQRLDVRTVRIVASAGRKVVPAGAVMYDDQGKEFVYISPESLTFVRHAVRVDRFDGDVAVLAAGPATGANVVTIGAAELYGVEHGLGISEED